MKTSNLMRSVMCSSPLHLWKAVGFFDVKSSSLICSISWPEHRVLPLSSGSHLLLMPSCAPVIDWFWVTLKKHKVTGQILAPWLFRLLLFQLSSHQFDIRVCSTLAYIAAVYQVALSCLFWSSCQKLRNTTLLAVFLLAFLASLVAVMIQVM